MSWRSLLIPLFITAIVISTIWAIIISSPTPLGFPLDDAWIHMVYGRSLAEEGLLSYNSGIPATGSTSPLWAICLAFLHILVGKFSISALILSVMILGNIFLMGVVLVLTDLTYRLTKDRVVAISAGILTAFSTTLASSAFSGMEVTLCALLLCAGVRDVFLLKHLRAGIWLALATLTRPESVSVSFACFLVSSVAMSSFQIRRQYWRSLVMLALPSLVLGTILIGYNLWASGRPLPATFYFKQQWNPFTLPQRLWKALADIYSQIPPFLGGISWAAILGYFIKPKLMPIASWLPIISGLLYLIASLLMIHPGDPQAFYHIRYILPSVPLLIIALAIGVYRLQQIVSPRFQRAPILCFLAIGVFGGAVSLLPVSRHFINDIRNINEVQRRMGEWIRDNTKPDEWIAASDAGAVKYFSNRPTIDVMGLNTPEIHWQAPNFRHAHPIVALALMPAWFSPLNPERLQILSVMKTANYTVTSNKRMRQQLILGCKGSKPIPIHFAGIISFSLDCLPWKRP